MKPRHLTLLLTSGLLAGCIPAPYGPYYRPSYPDPSAVMTQANCGGQAGPPSRLSFALPDGISVSLNTSSDTPGTDASTKAETRSVLRLALSLPPGSRLAFLEDRLQIDAGDGTALLVSPPASVSATHPLQAGDTMSSVRLAPVDPERLTAHSMPGAPVFTAKASFGLVSPDYQPDRLTLTLPALRHDGSTLNLPPLQLDAAAYRPGWHNYSTADARAKQQAEHRQCQTKTPEQHCEYLLTTYEEGFRSRHGEVEASGRLLIIERPQGHRLDAYLDYAFFAGDTWQLASDQATLVDTANGARRDLPLTSLVAHIQLTELPLSTAVRNPSSDGRGKVTMWLDIPLPGSAARYTIQLPEVEINGKRHRPKPLTLERRLLDGGIEPFNC